MLIVWPRHLAGGSTPATIQHGGAPRDGGAGHDSQRRRHWSAARALALHVEATGWPGGDGDDGGDLPGGNRSTAWNGIGLGGSSGCWVGRKRTRRARRRRRTGSQARLPHGRLLASTPAARSHGSHGGVGYRAIGGWLGEGKRSPRCGECNGAVDGGGEGLTTANRRRRGCGSGEVVMKLASSTRAPRSN